VDSALRPTRHLADGEQIKGKRLGMADRPCTPAGQHGQTHLCFSVAWNDVRIFGRPRFHGLGEQPSFPPRPKAIWATTWPSLGGNRTRSGEVPLARNAALSGDLRKRIAVPAVAHRQNARLRSLQPSPRPRRYVQPLQRSLYRTPASLMAPLAAMSWRKSDRSRAQGRVSRAPADWAKHALSCR